jgi:hypothetical protein
LGEKGRSTASTNISAPNTSPWILAPRNDAYCRVRTYPTRSNVLTYKLKLSRQTTWLFG